VKQYKEKPDTNKNNTENGKGTFFGISYLTYIILLAIFLFSFYIRGITPIDTVFRNGVVGFAMDDSVFHMKLVENTIQFFPHRIFFDAFTFYPFGTSLHWGPLFDQTIAFLALVAGLILNGGMPSQSMIDTIGAFFPAVIGALVVFPVYFIGKELIDNKAGILGAFLITILPGQFLSRSVLGFTDHHVAEVFLTTLMMAFFIMAIKRSENITFNHWVNKDWAALKVPISYSILAGLSLGAFLLTWTYGVFFAVVFGIFIFVQYIIDHFRKKSTEYLGIIGIISYTIAMIMVFPYIEINNGFAPSLYSLLHLTVTGGAVLFFLLLSFVSREMNKREYKVYHYLSFVIGAMLVALIFLKIFIPELYNTILGSWNSVFLPHTGGGLTIAEGSPISYESAVGNFGYNYILSYIAILLLCYYAIKKSNAEYTLLVIWSVFVLGIMLAQNRFAYYYAVNVAILSGVLGSRFLDLAGWKQFNSNDIIDCLKKIRVQHIVSLILVIAVTGFLPSGASPFQTTMDQAKWGAVSSGFYEWHDALTWMKDNTPTPDLPYYSIYEKPLPGQKYNYSKNDYGVMSWWDYGHIITYWGHRIPNANPFQSGIGGGDSHAPGASTFLIAPTEDQANKVLDDLGINGNPGARYVVSNAYMAYSIQPVFAEWDNTNQGYYEPVQTSQGTQYWPSMKYYNTMESKLHIFDTNGLRNYRLVHESTPNPYTSGGNEEKVYKSIYNTLNRASLIPAEESGYAKIFEHVKGAKITGNAPPNMAVTLTNTIKTNIGRTVQYKQVTSSNGTYELIVPYSTLGPISGQTQFDTKPTGAYTVTAGNISKQVEITEKDVLEGGTVTLDLV
jgi:dolichyl-diphosphooligosaccharide--protein glycosyltransferase